MSEAPGSASSQQKKIGFSGDQVANAGVETTNDLGERPVHGAASPRRTRRSIIRRETGIAGLIVACVVLFSLYVRVADYGFYEDDYWGVVPYFKTPPSEMWARTISDLQTWPTGRPLNHILPRWFSWLGYHLAGVQGIYFLGFLVHSTNAFLVYLLLRRWLGHWAAVLAGCFFVLLPVDTTRIFLLHSAHVHTSLTFLLVALLINRTRYWLLSYPIAGLSLLSYETAFLPFIVFPLFFVGSGKRISRWLIHLAGCGTVLFIVFGIRLWRGESRANSLISGPGEMLWRALSSLWIGPETCLRILAKAILQAPHGQQPFALLFAMLIALLVVLLLRMFNKPDMATAETQNRSKILTVFLAGLASWIFAYALTLVNYPPTQETGRFTSTHVAAVFGLACAIAAVAAYLRSFRTSPLKVAATTLMTILVAMFTLYAFQIQSGFAAAWAQERRFWQQVIQLCPDIAPNTRIILVGVEPAQNKFIKSNSWADPLVLGDAFSWGAAPLLFYYDGAGPVADIRFDDGQVTWKPKFWGDQRETLNLNNVIILRDDGSNISRIDEFQMREIPIPLHTKTLESTQPHASPTPLTGFGRFLLNN
ncbi:MAG: glycosyltransferase family 39 protein [Verrucomicrobia bacterium]|nr:glycosyltransferase family 39 protein [Verrucomicrobiota bacterium]